MYGLVMDMDFPMYGGTGALEHGTRSQSRMGNSFGPQGSRTDYATAGLAQHANHV